ncbi:MAG TPA: hypothetical protein VJ851_00840 [Jatrophihabitans sp.]|nr:hypothetical protein [Jatrophihabitans sp.]
MRMDNGGDDVRLVNRLATGVAIPADSDRRLRRAWPFWPLLVLLCGTSVAVGVAMIRAALSGPAGVFWWLALVLGFVLGHLWERAQARERHRLLTYRLRDQSERVRALEASVRG